MTLVILLIGLLSVLLMLGNVSITTNYAGDVIEEIMVKAAVGNETVAQGLINIETGIRKQRSIPRANLSNIIQDRAETPTPQGTMTHTERVLAPQDFMVYVEFNPNDYRHVWDFMQSSDPFVFGELAPEVQRVLIQEVMDGESGVNEFMGTNIWTGDQAGAAPNNKYDGLVTKALADADVIDVVGTTLTAGNIIAELQKVYDASPVVLRRDPDYAITIPISAFEFYTNALRDLTNKSIDPTEEAPAMFRGKKLVPLVAMPDDTMVATKMRDDRQSNIYLGLSAAEDFNALKIMPLQNNSELWFIKLLMAADTQIKFGERFVLYS